MKNIYKVLVAASGLFAMSACTDLTEHIYSDNTTDNFIIMKQRCFLRYCALIHTVVLCSLASLARITGK